MTQEQTKKQSSKTELEEVDVAPEDIRDEDLDQDVTDILDDIDDILEVNAEEFVQGFIQKGGQ